MDEKMRGMTIMDQNRFIEAEKDKMRRERDDAERDNFNKQMTEINAHARQREEKQRQWNNW